MAILCSMCFFLLFCVRLGVKRGPNGVAIIDIIVIVVGAGRIQFIAIICIIIIRGPGPGISKPPENKAQRPRQMRARAR